MTLNGSVSIKSIWSMCSKLVCWWKVAYGHMARGWSKIKSCFTKSTWFEVDKQKVCVRRNRLSEGSKRTWPWLPGNGIWFFKSWSTREAHKTLWHKVFLHKRPHSKRWADHRILSNGCNDWRPYDKTLDRSHICHVPEQDYGIELVWHPVASENKKLNV